MRLEGKIALITGAGAGIMKQQLYFCKKKVQKLLSLIETLKMQKVADQIGENAFAVAVDVAKSSDVKAMVKAGAEHFGGLDILVNNAGFGTLGTVVTLEEDLWDSVIDVNLKGVFLCSKFAIPELIRRGGGSIVNLASTISVVGIPDRAAYVAAKGGVAALTRAMALDHANEGIRVNSVAPGVINSSYYDKMFKEVEDPVAFKKA